MLDLIEAIEAVLDRSAKKAIIEWFSSLPRGAAWHMISDYVFSNRDRHDTAAFVVLLHHDKLATIRDYIENQAPADIKKVQSPSEGLIHYLNSPVAFSFTFVLDDGDTFLADYAPAQQIIRGLEDLRDLAGAWALNTGHIGPYFSDVQLRLKSFIVDLQHKGNAKLARQVYLVAAYAAVVLDYLDQATDPAQVSWISDRDAILQRHDGVVWDMTTVLFYLLKGRRAPSQANGTTLLETPRIIHVVPESAGHNYLDPLVRMADYLAAAASDMNLHTFEFSHAKLRSIALACFSEAKNHILCTISWNDQGFLVRRLVTTSVAPT